MQTLVTPLLVLLLYFHLKKDLVGGLVEKPINI